MSRVAGYLALSVAAEIFENPNAFLVNGTIPNGVATLCDREYRVSKHWIFGSGSNHAMYTGLSRVTAEGCAKGMPMVACNLRADQVNILDTWHVSGLRVIGSQGITKGIANGTS